MAEEHLLGSYKKLDSLTRDTDTMFTLFLASFFITLPPNILPVAALSDDHHRQLPRLCLVSQETLLRIDLIEN